MTHKYTFEKYIDHLGDMSIYITQSDSYVVMFNRIKGLYQVPSDTFDESYTKTYKTDEYFENKLFVLVEDSYNRCNSLNFKTILLDKHMISVTDINDLRIKTAYTLECDNNNYYLFIFDLNGLIKDYDFRYLDFIYHETSSEIPYNLLFRTSIIKDYSVFECNHKQIDNSSLNRIIRVYNDMSYDLFDFVDNMSLTRYGLNYFPDKLI